MTPLRSLVLLACLLPAAPGADDNRIALRADLWFPINGEPRAARPGFGIEILNAVWAPAGYSIDYRLMPWRRSLELVRGGKADCVIGAYLTDAPRMLYPLEPLAFDGVALYALSDREVNYDGPETLRSLRVGVIGGYSYGAEFDAWVAANQDSPDVQVMQGSEALDKNVRKLLSGRLDVLVESPLVMQARLEAMNLESRIRRVATVREAMPLFVACGSGRGAREWLKVYDRGMTRLRENGRLADIYRRYGIDPEAQEQMRAGWPGTAPDTPFIPAETGLPDKNLP